MLRNKRKASRAESPRPSTSNTLYKDQDLAFYVHDRVGLLREAFSLLKTKEIKSIAPGCVRNDSLDDIKELCLEELLGISSKRLCALLDGADPPTDTDTSTDESEQEDNDVIALDSDSSDSESQRRRKKHKKTKKRKRQSTHNSTNSPKSISENAESRLPESSGSTVLELLELQARARAIRAHLMSNNDATKITAETTESNEVTVSDDEIEIKEEEPEIVEIISSDEEIETKKEKESPKRVEEITKDTTKRTKTVETTKPVETVKTVEKAKTHKTVEKAKTAKTVEKTKTARNIEAGEINNKTQNTLKNKKKKRDKKSTTTVGVKVKDVDNDEITLHLSDSEQNAILDLHEACTSDSDDASSSTSDTGSDDSRVNTNHKDKHATKAVSSVESNINDADKADTNTNSLVENEDGNNTDKRVKSHIVVVNNPDVGAKNNDVNKADPTVKSHIVVVHKEVNKADVRVKSQILVVNKDAEKGDISANSDDSKNNDSNKGDAIVKSLMVVVNKDTSQDKSSEENDTEASKAANNRTVKEIERNAMHVDEDQNDSTTNNIVALERDKNTNERQVEKDGITTESQENISVINIEGVKDIEKTDSLVVVNITLDKNNIEEKGNNITKNKDDNDQNIPDTAETVSNQNESNSNKETLEKNEKDNSMDIEETKETNIDNSEINNQKQDTTANSNTKTAHTKENLQENIKQCTSIEGEQTRILNKADSVRESISTEQVNDNDITETKNILDTCNKEQNDNLPKTDTHCPSTVNITEQIPNKTSNEQKKLSDGELSSSSSEVLAIEFKPEIVCISDDETSVKKKKSKKEKKSKKKKKIADKDIDNESNIQDKEKSPDPEIYELSDDSCYEGILSKEPTREEIEAFSAKIDKINRDDIVTEEEIQQHDNNAVDENVSWRDRYLDSKKVKKVLKTSNIINAMRKKNIELKRKMEEMKKINEISKQIDQVAERIDPVVIETNVEEGSIDHYNTLEGSTKYVDPIKENDPEDKLLDMKKDAKMLLKLYKKLAKYNNAEGEGVKKKNKKSKKKKKETKNKSGDA